MKLIKAVGLFVFLLGGMIFSGEPREFVFQNDTNLPLVVKQGSHEVAFCMAFESKRGLIYNSSVECYLGKRKHRASCVPVSFDITPAEVGMLVTRDDKMAFFKTICLISEFGGTAYQKACNNAGSTGGLDD